MCWILLLLNACEKEQKVDTNESINNQGVTFEGIISKTRVTENTWDKGDAIGIFAIKAEGTIPEDIVNDISNIKFITNNADGKFTAESTKIYFPETEVDFIAYYPYQEGIKNGIYEIDITNEDTLGDIDLLYSDNAKSLSGSHKDVNLSFCHMLSMVTLEIITEEEIPSIEEMTIDIKDVTTKATFNLSNKDIINKEQFTNKITPKVILEKTKGTAKATAIMIPGQEMSNTTIVFTIGKNVIEWKPKNNILESNNWYNYKIKLSHTEATEIGDCTINDWIKTEVDDEFEITINPEDKENNESDNDTNTKDKLLYLGSNFNNEEEFTDTKIIPNNTTKGLIQWRHEIGINSSPAIHLEANNANNSNRNENDFVYAAKVDENKLMNPSKQISIFIKGKSENGITFCLTEITETGRQSSAYYYVDNSNMNNIITPTKKRKDYDKAKQGIDTKDEWIEIQIDTSNLNDLYDEVQIINTFGILIERYKDYDIIIDDITIK